MIMFLSLIGFHVDIGFQSKPPTNCALPQIKAATDSDMQVSGCYFAPAARYWRPVAFQLHGSSISGSFSVGSLLKTSSSQSRVSTFAALQLAKRE